MEVENKKKNLTRKSKEESKKNQANYHQNSSGGLLLAVRSRWQACESKIVMLFVTKKEAKFRSLQIVNTPKALRAIETC